MFGFSVEVKKQLEEQKRSSYQKWGCYYTLIVIYVLYFAFFGWMSVHEDMLYNSYRYINSIENDRKRKFLTKILTLPKNYIISST